MSLTKNSFLKSIGYISVKLKFLKTNHYLLKASSATSNMEDTRLSKNNAIKIRKWRSKISLISIDMTHINKVLSEKETESVDGIIGADVLKKSKAVIDYESNKLYLKIKI